MVVAWCDSTRAVNSGLSLRGRGRGFLPATMNVAPGGVLLPYVGYIGMCPCEGYGFQAVYSRMRYINQNIWV